MSKKNTGKSNKQFNVSGHSIARVTWMIFVVLIILAMFASIVLGAILVFFPTQTTQTISDAEYQQLLQQLNQSTIVPTNATIQPTVTTAP